MLLKMIRGSMADSFSVDGREDMVLTPGTKKIPEIYLVHRLYLVE